MKNWVKAYLFCWTLLDSDTGKGGKKKKKADSESDVSYFSETSVGGTRHIMQRKRIRDEEGNVIGYGKKKEYQPTGKHM